ncbi:unnamed protein product [Rhizophagus irregularis]|nr:hypothetical protein RIR_jg19391.t1 [Rhizophagus irregularis DAOM 181602=DAOM 197198]CAB4406240.1 unnamed protein product [Rhizophagus irregularis]CAB5196174.1 unnamed protein product [Rhizophagus irregularis]
MPFLFNSVFHIINDGIPSPNSEILKNYLDAAPLTELYLELKVQSLIKLSLFSFLGIVQPTRKNSSGEVLRV